MAVTGVAVPVEVLTSEHNPCPLLLAGARLRLAVLGKIQPLLRAVTPLIMVRGRNKMFPSRPKKLLEFLQYFQYCSWSGNCSQQGFTRFFVLPHFCMPVSRVVIWAGMVENQPRFPFRWY